MRQAAVKKIAIPRCQHGDGTVDRDELEKALKKLGFYHLKDAQLDQILQRADDNDDCVIDYDEFVKEYMYNQRLQAADYPLCESSIQ